MDRRLGAALIAAALAAACGGVTSPSANTTEMFTDTLTPGGTKIKNISVPKSGEYKIVLDAISPPANFFIGVVWGQAQTGGCAQIQGNPFVTVGQQALGGLVSSGSYCVMVYDSSLGAMTVNETFTVRIEHP